MANVVVVGSQWGDEGKGKIVDWLSEQADIVVRFQGGHNAGHTLVIDGITYKLSLLPSGVVRPGKLSVIGNGVVIDPHALLEEIDRLGGQGVDVTPQSLRIAENATLILPLHQELDTIRESSNTLDPRRHHQARHRPGLRGQGRPARDPRHGSRRSAGARAQDRAAAGASQRAAARPRARGSRRRYGLRPARRASRPRVLPYMDSVWSLLDQKRREGKRILFEGAQGALLDIDHGTYPFVTSSNTVAAQAATGSGVGPAAIGYVLGICKAYTTRVGRGAVPDRAEQRDRPADRRARPRVRHRDRPAAALRLVRRRARAPDRPHQRHQRLGADQARHSGWFGRNLRFAWDTASTDGKSIIFRRASTPRPRSSRSTRPSRAGRTATARARSWAELPAQAIKYVRRVEELVGCPVALLSTSPEREDTILMHNPFEN